MKKNGKKPAEPRRDPQICQGLLIGKANFEKAILNSKIERRGNRLFKTREIALITTSEMCQLLDCSSGWLGKLAENGLITKAQDETGRQLHGLWDAEMSMLVYLTFVRGQASKADGSLSEMA